MTPLVSCLMLTYNRGSRYLSLIDEAVHSFLQQDYQHKELILLNDTPGQVLRCSAPNVRVVNLSERLPTLGEKLNYGFSLAQGEVLMRMDDDDVYLPNRISRSVAELSVFDYVKPRHIWYMPGRELRWDPAGFSTGAFTKRGFDLAGGFSAMDSGEDQDFELKFSSNPLLSKKLFKISPEDTFYLYRWANGSPHVSGYPDRTGYQRMGQEPIQAGTFTLKPTWRYDYVALVKQAVTNKGKFAWAADQYLYDSKGR